MKKTLSFLFAVALSILSLPLCPASARASVDARTERPVAGKFIKVRGAVPGEYIVVFGEETPAAKVESLASELVRARGGRIRYVYQYALKGFAVRTTEAAAVAFSRDPRVAYVEEAGKVYLMGTQAGIVTQGSTFYGIDRIDQFDLPLDSTYHYNRVGSGVNVYVIDTGIRLSHVEFGTRAHADYDFARSPSDPLFGYDNFNHGTAVASVIGGRTYGVAKNVQLHSVRVLNDISASVSNLIAGIDYVTGHAIKPAVANISLGFYDGCGNATQRNQAAAIDNAVQGMINSGVTAVVGAGDLERDAGCTAPARLPAAITVGSTTDTDARTPGSSFGFSLDLFAPGAGSGKFIPVAGSHSDTENEGFSFTSAAAPHVAGVAALYLEEFSINNPTAPETLPGNVSAAITGNATPGRVSNITTCYYDWETGEEFCYETSPNLLLYSGFVAPPSSNPVDDQRFYTRQQYYDALSRTPDGGGWDGWTNYINGCSGDGACINQRRITTARGFLESIEFRNNHTILRDNPVGSQAYNEEYVRLLYVCYLQRNPEPGGFDAWLNYINTHPGDYDNLVGGFINSVEYRLRFL
jgi:subtilisin family serine protease